MFWHYVECAFFCGHLVLRSLIHLVMQRGAVRVAVVVATTDDRATEFVLPAASAACKLLRRSDLLVLRFVPINERSDLRRVLLGVRHFFGDRRVKFVVAYISGHGSASQDGSVRRIVGTDSISKRFTVFDVSTAEQFTQPFLLLTSCLGDGQFADDIVQQVIGSQVIGYVDDLVVPADDARRKILDDDVYAEYREAFCAVLTTPLQFISYRSVLEAKKATWDSWISLYYDQRFSDMRIRSIADTNAGRLRCWRNGE